jgi:hypothetical protein
MKNIHILPTTQPSKLYLGNNGLLAYGFTQTSIQSANEDFTNQFLYITNDEEIKDGDYYINFEEGFGPKSYKYKDYGVESLNINNYNCKKIILTNDPLLIKDGVQPIDDEFLHWFVKNSSCEEVKVESEMYMPQSNGKISDGKITHELSLDPSQNTLPYYRIIIPKEEPKQETLEEASKDYIENTMKFSFNSLDTQNTSLEC